MEMYESGELHEALGLEAPPAEEAPEAPAAGVPSTPMSIENRL
jgi:hypothetical protein